ncbi:MAG: hypothetical protein ACRC92_26190 [Peptostreptococcaceae bacterium]
MGNKYIVDESFLLSLGLKQCDIQRLHRDIVIKSVTVGDIIRDLLNHDISMYRPQTLRSATIEQCDLKNKTFINKAKLHEAFEIKWDYDKLETKLNYPYKWMKGIMAEEEESMRRDMEWLNNLTRNNLSKNKLNLK